MTAWPHQTEGVAFALSRPHAYLNWGMGSGKTRAGVMIAMESRVVMVVCPQSVGPSWVRHFAELDPDREIVEAFAGGGDRRAAAIAAAGRGHRRLAIIVNYDSVWRPAIARAIETKLIECLICDEAQRLKTPGAKASRYLHRLATKKFPGARRLCLSGTPLPNSPLDAYGQWRFLDETVFGTSFAAFRSRYAIPHPKFPQGTIGYRNEDELAAKMAECSHTVSTDAVLSLPPEQHVTVEVQLSAAEVRFYVAMATQFVAEIESGGLVTAANAMVKLLRLQQACSGHTAIRHDDGRVEKFLLDDSDKSGRTSKGRALADWLADVPDREPVVVFSKFREDLEQTRIAAKAAGRACFMLAGGVNELDQWQLATGGEVLAVQLQSGGVGIDLSRASIAAYMSIGHSLGEYEQSLARTRRYGQKGDRCLFYHFVAAFPLSFRHGSRAANKTADALVYAALTRKEQVIDSVRDMMIEAHPEGARHARAAG
jgi:hypothetical protein